MIRHIRKLAIINDAATDEVTLLSNVTDGVDGATTFGLGDDDETNDLTIEDQQTINNTVTRRMNIRTLIGTSGEETNIEGYVSNFTDVYVVGLGLDGAVLIGDKETTTGAVKLIKNEQRSTNRVWELMASVQTQPGFDPSTGLYESGFWAGKNLLGGYVWGDADGNGVADGWGAIGFTSESFSSGQQTLESDSTLDIFERAIYFPFEGEQLTASITVDTFNAINTFGLRMSFRDNTDAEISNSETSISSTGRKSVTGTTPANTVTIRVQLRMQTSSGTVNEVVSDPALRLGTATTYTKY